MFGVFLSMEIQKLKCLILFLFVFTNLYGQNIFVLQNPNYSPESINSIKFFNNTGWAAGNYGLILKTNNRGQTYVKQSVQSFANINRVFILDSLTCYLLDDSSRIYKTTNGGNVWHLNSVFNAVIKDVHFINQSTGFITTENNIGITYNGGTDWIFESPDNSSQYLFYDVNVTNNLTVFITALNQTNDYAYVFKSTNMGINWVWYNTTVDGLEMNNTYFVDNQTGWCAGTRFDNLFILKTSNGGVNWSESHSNYNSFNNNNIYFQNNLTGYITSLTKVIKTTNGGLNWYTLLSGNGFQTSFFYNDSLFYLADRYSQVLRTSTAGSSFDTLLGRQNTTLNNIQSISQNVLWCNGINASNWKSVNGGANWYYDSYSASLNIKYTYFTDVNTGYSIANRGMLYRTTNFGNNWQTIYDYAGEIFSLYFINNLTGWSFGDNMIIKTTNGGVNWIILNNTSSIRNAKFTDEQHAYGYDGNKLLRTTDGGVNWAHVTADFITDYSFINALTGWVVSSIDTSALIQKTTNGGNSWNSVSVTDENINKIKFINQSTGYLLSYNRLYRTTNSGVVWRRVSIPTSLRIFAMDISDENTGWLCGENSVILKLENGSWIYVNSEINNIPGFELYQNFPNPFNSETSIKFNIHKQSMASLKVYDIQGREVKVLLNQYLSTGIYNIKFDSFILSSGIYFYVLKTDNISVTRKLVLLK